MKLDPVIVTIGKTEHVIHTPILQIPVYLLIFALIIISLPFQFLLWLFGFRGFYRHNGRHYSYHAFCSGALQRKRRMYR